MKGLAVAFFAAMITVASGITKVACVGDSITYGARIEQREWLSYPAQLQRMLGADYEIRNFGVSGATLLKKGNAPYWKKSAYKDALRWRPDVVVIKLGTNDTKANNWKHKADFEADLSELVQSFQNLSSEPMVVLSLPVPAFCSGGAIDGGRVRDGVIPAVRAVAKELNLPLIDFYTRLLNRKELFPDRIHPNAAGAFELAAEVYETITGAPFIGEFSALKTEWTQGLPPEYSDWKGFRRSDFKLGQTSCVVVSPKKAAPGNPWIWRARFFGHEPQTDIALLERGFHVAYCDVSGLFGSPQAVKRWDAFYECATVKLGLSEKVALEGMSRGGLIIFNWARANPEKVACIYADAPVCDITSWPAGAGRGKEQAASWEKCIKAYGFKDESAALAYEQNPVDSATELARAGFPILFVYGQADVVVPPDENCTMFAEAFSAAGGVVEMIAKEGVGHHPHSLKDPSAIVDFILAAYPKPPAQKLSLGSPFGEHMVLQRAMPVPVWGAAAPGEIITVEFAGQTKTAIADVSSRWKVTLDPMPASFQPLEMIISSGSKDPAIHYSDVLVGEVWICSGQSNMQMGYNGIPEIKALAAKAKNIRSFTVKNKVAFEEQEELDGTWVVAAPASAVACSFAYFLEQTAGVPVGIILTAWGSSSIEAWMPRDMTRQLPYFKTIMEEFDADLVGQSRIKAALASPEKWSGADDVYLRRQPNIVYNAMMKPLAPYACRGLVWYQGERNTRFMSGMPAEPQYKRVCGMREYGDVLKLWIQRYRRVWNNDDMHFLIVSLPAFGNRMVETGRSGAPDDPAVHSWAWMRESQYKALELPGVDVVNTIDLGDLKNIHPKDKLPVGQRLALLAERDRMDQQLLVEGPIMKNVQERSGSLVVQFSQADGLKTINGEAPSAFWIADESAQWVRADAEIEGETVVLRSAELKRPLYIRYAFVGMPMVNLVNAADLPARPFRTDQFEP